ncbi:hypothetical protein HBE96_23790 [Clostridium sp. P21]|uniref:Uncharacterized protein n=1 Tax=Clostridium muellerianum TaxID=2716538 RepID=A0A7Y0ELC4_9CLOT|nr:hypothetical protein [Clostridium muellerianum]NMM65603.1 hypothetical protein [Clostridium muellerianum]
MDAVLEKIDSIDTIDVVNIYSSTKENDDEIENNLSSQKDKICLKMFDYFIF